MSYTIFVIDDYTGERLGISELVERLNELEEAYVHLEKKLGDNGYA